MPKSEGSVQGPHCVVLDVRVEGAQKLVGCWLRALRQALVYEQMNMSIISVHDDYYVSRLPLAYSSETQVAKALENLEQDCVLQPMGLASWPGLVPEHLAGLTQGLPVGSHGTKKRKADGRLFAIGEDAGLAALRSAGQALAAEVGDGLLQYWTVDATRLFPVAADVVKSLPSNIALEVVLAVSESDQQEVKIKLLQQELTSKVRLESLLLADATVARKVLEPFRRSWPMQLRLPDRCLALRARSAVLLLKQWMPQGSPPCIEIVSEVPLARLSCELLFGAPIFLEDTEMMEALMAQLQDVALLACCQLQPVCLQATRCRHFYAIMLCRGQLLLRGLAADRYMATLCIASMIETLIYIEVFD